MLVRALDNEKVGRLGRDGTNFLMVDTSGDSVVVVLRAPNLRRVVPKLRFGLRLGTTSDSICWLSLKRWSSGRLDGRRVGVSVEGSPVTTVDNGSAVSSESFSSRESGSCCRMRLSLVRTSLVMKVDSISLDTSEITVVKSEFPTALSG